MAQRFGGKFSPDGRNRPDQTTGPAGKGGLGRARRRMAPVAAGGARVNVLFTPAIVLAATVLNDGPVNLAIGLLGAALWAGAAWMTREGLQAEREYHARAVARRPAMPRKIAGSVLIGMGTVLAGMAHGTDLLGSAIYGLVAAALHLAAFGPDPLRDKVMEGIDTYQQDRVARVVEKAEDYLRDMGQAVDTLRDRRLTARVAAFQDTAAAMIEQVENDPRDLTSARKFLGVYLMGARDATVKFVSHYSRNRSDAARTDYEALLTDLEQNFAARSQKMLQDDATDMTIEIEVLRDRLQREGIRPHSESE
ncbi:5-bromo-4-chloroindolyl phosphate hydrolysis family protein [Pseudooceanicola aestuarii]|uniref:5-bromo-4-chloroindolyl phosphate hydrolysis family protein n=1 Tax=Pseudooceanicola aestuarii TaxID=2697319 RepID=UPI0013D57A9E|nr:5-bromo-4-chloroindolyl phosphate hydrolysis family protein [Pseudooceanicola aestuarii]